MENEDQSAFSDEWMKGEAEAVEPSPAVKAVQAAAAASKDAEQAEYSAAHAELDAKDAAKEQPKAVEAPKTFGEAFKAARAKGEKVFEFQGKKYTTELASEKPAKKVEKAEKPADWKPSGAPAKPFVPPASDVPDSTPMVSKLAPGSFGKATDKTAETTKPGGLSLPAGVKSTAEAVPKHAFMGKSKA